MGIEDNHSGDMEQPKSTVEPIPLHPDLDDGESIVVAAADIAAVIYELRQEHRDLDQAIAALNSTTGSDQMRISRLKKRKLHLKDQITYWESRQIPDLNA